MVSFECQHLIKIANKRGNAISANIGGSYMRIRVLLWCKKRIEQQMSIWIVSCVLMG